MDACEVDKIINGGPPGAASIDDELENIQTNGTSHRRGNVEAACAQAKRYMEGTTGCRGRRQERDGHWIFQQ